MSFLSELKRRNVLRVGTAYVISSWLIIQVVETIFPLFGFGDTPARLVVIVLTIAFIPSLIFSWVFEITPEGLKKDTDIDREQSITQVTGKKLDRIILAVLALALGYFAFDKFVLDPVEDVQIAESAHQEGRAEAFTESFGDKSIVVLPFLNMSSDPEQDYFSDGISEELMNLLSKIPELRVISRSSAFSYKGKDIKLADVARELNVANILEGSVRKDGNQVRITAQLIEARSDTHLWSETYDRTLDHIFNIQDEIGSAVVNALKLKLLGDVPRAKPVDPEAYMLYLQATYVGAQGTAEAWEQSNAMLKHVLNVAPDYARAWRGLAKNYANQVADDSVRPSKESEFLSREANRQALTIDPDSVEAHSLLGIFAMFYDMDLPAAARHFEYALSQEPTNLVALLNSSIFLAALGRLDDAIAVREYGLVRDPLYPQDHRAIAETYWRAGRLDEAIASIRTALMLSPRMHEAHSSWGMALLLKGENKAALKVIQQEPSERHRLPGLVMAYHTLGQAAESDAVLAELIEKYEQELACPIAYTLAYRDEANRAFDWLNKAVEYNDNDLALIAVESRFSNIYDDPRWLPFLESIGKSPAQLAAIKFEVTLPE